MASESHERQAELQVVVQEPEALWQADYRLEDKISGALLGGAIADAMGWATEFIRGPEQLKKHYRVDRLEDFVAWEKKTGGRFNTYIEYVGPGEYSDDTQLTLSTARAMLPNGECDVAYFASSELPYWLQYARGAGATITAAAKGVQRRNTTWNNNFFSFKRGTAVLDYSTAGANGAAMRISPIALANPFDLRNIERGIWRNAIVTHGHPRAVVGALVYGVALSYVLTTATPKTEDFIQRLREFCYSIKFPVDDPELKNWRTACDARTGRPFEHELVAAVEQMGGFIRTLSELRPVSTAKLHEMYVRFGCFTPATKGSGTATVAAALTVFLCHGKNFEHTVIEAINMLGSDTDTIAAMAGTLAGAYLGYSAMPERWATQMQDFPYFVRVAGSLARIAVRKARGTDLRPVGDPSVRLPNIARAEEVVSVASGQRVSHPVLGLGSVRSVDIQPLRRRQGGSMKFIWVDFDCGQSCKFRFFRSELLPEAAQSQRPTPPTTGNLFRPEARRPAKTRRRGRV